MEREKLRYEDALRVIRKDDDERRQWSLKVFGVAHGMQVCMTL